jgi:hypothetical protein
VAWRGVWGSFVGFGVRVEGYTRGGMWGDWVAFGVGRWVVLVWGHRRLIDWQDHPFCRQT